MAAALAMAPLLESIGLPLHLQAAPVDAPETVRWLASRGETTPTVELPMPGHRGRRHQNATYMLWSTHHFQPIANGYSALFPSSFYELAEALEEIPSRESIEMLRREGIRYVSLHRDLYLRERARRLEEAMDEEADLKEVFTSERAVVYEVLPPFER